MLSESTKKSLRLLGSAAWAYAALLFILPRILSEAFRIRLHAITEYGPVIHEFDVSFPNMHCIEIGVETEDTSLVLRNVRIGLFFTMSHVSIFTVFFCLLLNALPLCSLSPPILPRIAIL
jgi:hypothetical protein